jgi:hypothetical protein
LCPEPDSLHYSTHYPSSFPLIKVETVFLKKEGRSKGSVSLEASAAGAASFVPEPSARKPGWRKKGKRLGNNISPPYYSIISGLKGATKALSLILIHTS